MIYEAPMEMHKLLLEQLKKVGANEYTPPATKHDWQKFIDSVNNSYYQADQDRYLQDQSITSVTNEMNDLNHKLSLDINDYKTNAAEIAALQKAVIQSEKISVLAQISAGIAHEINNPLSFTLSNMAVLQKRLNFISNVLKAYQNLLNEIEILKIDQLTESISKITVLTNEKNIFNLITDMNNTLAESTSGLLRIKNIVMKMREFSGTKKVHMQHININDCILAAIQIISKESKIKCEIKKNLSDLPSTLGSYTQLVIVFANLLSNAQQAVNDNGTISITSKLEDSMIVVSIADNGSGISLENKSKIFTPFFTTRSTGSGTGLGLATVYGIIKLHDGKVSFESEKDSGSLFTIELPVKPLNLKTP